ncbi:hypothetical protein LguiA_027769 [Lonicera macranthoides]
MTPNSLASELDRLKKIDSPLMGYPQKLHRVVDVEKPPPFKHRTIPVTHSKPPKKRNCCCKFMCCTILLLVLVLAIIGTTAGVLYLLFQPKLPKYSVDQLKISDLRLNSDTSLDAQFDVKIAANNPNEKIGIYYEKQSHISVWYSSTKLCQGSLPVFYQGHQNMTKLNVGLTGHTQYGSTLMGTLQEQQQTGRIPLELKVDVPVRIKLGKWKVRKVRIMGRCSLMVDSLSANNVINIKTSNCSFRLKL